MHPILPDTLPPDIRNTHSLQAPPLPALHKRVDPSGRAVAPGVHCCQGVHPPHFARHVWSAHATDGWGLLSETGE